jgi:hypothetical protein
MKKMKMMVSSMYVTDPRRLMKQKMELMRLMTVPSKVRNINTLPMLPKVPKDIENYLGGSRNVRKLFNFSYS